MPSPESWNGWADGDGLRSILGFLHVDGAIDRSLLSAVPTVPGRRLTGLPKGLNPDQVKRLLSSASTDRLDQGALVRATGHDHARDEALWRSLPGQAVASEDKHLDKVLAR